MADRVNQLIKLKPFMIKSLCKTLTLIAVLDNFPPHNPANIGVDAPTAHYDASAEFMGIGVIFKTTPFYLTCSLFIILPIVLHFFPQGVSRDHCEHCRFWDLH